MVSYMGGEQVVGHYGIMGPIQVALGSATRYLTFELASRNIHVNTLLPKPILSRM